MLETSARLLKLLSLLQSRRSWTGPELAGRLEVGVRTVRRDVERLRSLGYPVHAAPGIAGGYRLGAGAELPPLLLDDEEAVAVAVGLRTAAGGSVAGIEETSLRALAKLEQLLPSRLRRRVNALQTYTVSLAGSPPTADPNVLATIAAACRDYERLRFSYRSHDRTTSTRTVEPYRLVHLGRRWYLVAWDAGREDWRTFRVDRIGPRLSTNRRFTPRKLPERDVGAYVSAAVSAARDRYQARVILHAPLAEAAKRVPPSYGALEAIDEHTCLLRTGADWLGGLAVYVAMIGVEFEVLEPPELVEQVRVLADRFRRAAPSHLQPDLVKMRSGSHSSPDEAMVEKQRRTPAIPAVMSAVRLRAPGGPAQLVLEQLETPRPRPGEALVRVCAAAITRDELEWPVDRLPATPSYEFAGVVVAVGPGVEEVTIGESVYALGGFDRDGAAAEYTVVPAAFLAPKPRTFGYVESAAVPLAALSAWQALFDHGNLAEGERVLIHGAAGGVGGFAVQLARGRGAHVVGTASTGNVATARELGADQVVDHTITRFEDVVEQVDLVFDTVGGERLERSPAVVRPGGRLVSVAAEPPRERAAGGGITALYFVVEPNREQLVEIARLVDSGGLRATIDEVFALADARKAFERSLGDHGGGKIVLRIADG